jgi:hypothetical protein
MTGRSDVKGGVGVATTWALAITIGDSLVVVSTQVLGPSPDRLTVCRPERAAWKRPQPGGDLAGVLYARIPHGRWGSGGLESARHVLTLRQIAFGICIKQLTLNRLWKSGITPHVGGT